MNTIEDIFIFMAAFIATAVLIQVLGFDSSSFTNFIGTVVP